MEDLVKERLENQAFMARVLRTSGEGLTVAEWIEFVSAIVTGYIGDVLVGQEDEALRVVLADQEKGSPSPDTGSDLVPTVLEAINFKLAEMSDPNTVETVAETVRMLRRLFSAGAYLECQMAGEGFALDFVRGRHTVTADGELLAMHVHGKTVMGNALDDASNVLSVGADGFCLLLDGTRRAFDELAFAEEAVKAGNIGTPPRLAVPKSPLVDRIMRSRAGSVEGPSPVAMIVSRGEDGRVMVALKSKIEDGKVSVRFLPAAVQVMVDGKVSAQSGFDEVPTVLGWLVDGAVEVLRMDGDKTELTRAQVEIRTSA
jgi:hypothetical protein|nr:hypothetical protein [Neorhizobium tomejilense]